MSKGKYGEVEISPEQRKRLEEERMRRQEEERRRLEEQRKREIEQRRREEIAAQKGRIALARRFREDTSLFQRRPVSGKSRSGRTESKASDLSAEMKEIATVMKANLHNFPESWRAYFTDDLEKVQRVLDEVEQCNYDPYYYPRLKESARAMARLAATAEEKIEAVFRRMKEDRQACESLLANMEIVAENSPQPEQRRRANTIIHALEPLWQTSGPDTATKHLHHLKKEGQNLWFEYDQLMAAKQVRSFVAQNVGEVLAELGYKVLEKSSQPQADTGTEEELLYFYAPQKGMVEVNLGSNLSFAASYIVPKRSGSVRTDGSVRELTEGCRRWCSDYNEFINRLAKRDVNVQNMTRLDPDEGDFKEVVFPEPFFEEEDFAGILPEVKYMRREM
ncbi:hypothetical protein [Dethiobacter alkaliphilus]|uniref:hypothetical protein n=1 Tax=Dethiobacter alkaliphilus TaxID=427926 RepID=UPI0022273CFB|nr:hypothetical protein [Dethiobacter alkaliphilus]MCW3488665.1 hypothetical protein [Dethiobacter alkaliphilus]